MFDALFSCRLYLFTGLNIPVLATFFDILLANPRANPAFELYHNLLSQIGSNKSVISTKNV